MRTITGLFDTYDHARQAVRALRDAGVPDDDISVLASDAEDALAENNVAEGAGAGAGIGAMVGGTGGLLAGLGALAIPGIGPVIAGGWLVTTVVGAVAGAAVGGAAGGLIGTLTRAGVPEAEAHVYAEGVRRGGALVTARVDEGRADTAAAILRNAHGVDIEERRRDYEAEGWQRFDEEAPALSPEDMREARASHFINPPII